MRVVAVLVGTVTLIGAIVQLFLAVVLSIGFCDENCDPHRVSSFPSAWLVIGAATVVAFTAGFFVVSISFGSPRYAALGLGIHLVAAVSLLTVWLHESHASDGRLIGYFLEFESLAVAALILSVAERRKRGAQGSHPPSLST